jgi:hypothetical protein
MPGLASLVHNMRRSLASWLLPEIHDLLLQRLNQEKNAENDTAVREEHRADVPAAFGAQQPPEDWLARVREGAPQLLVKEGAGGVPSMQVGDFSGENRESGATAEPGEQLDTLAQPLDDSSDSPRTASLNRSARAPLPADGSSTDRAAAQPGRSSEQPEKATAATRLSDSGKTLLGMRERIANALHAAANAVSTDKSQTLNRGARLAADLPFLRRILRTGLGRQGPALQDETVDRPAPQSRAVTDGLQQVTSRLREEKAGSAEVAEDLHTLRYEEISSQQELQRRPRPSAPEKRPANAGDTYQALARPAKTVEAQQPSATYTRAQRRMPDVPIAAAAPSRSPGQGPTLVVRSTQEIQPRASSFSSPETRPEVTNPLRLERRPWTSHPKRWPALLARPRERESPTESLAMQQRYAMLMREQAGVD